MPAYPAENERRPASMPPSPVSPGQDLRLASEAMQRAAHAMIAATESFREQFRAQQKLAARPATFHCTNMPGTSGSTPARRPSVEIDTENHNGSDSPDLWLRYLDTNSDNGTAAEQFGSGGPAHATPLPETPANPSPGTESSTKVTSPPSTGTSWSKSAGSTATLANTVTPSAPLPADHPGRCKVHAGRTSTHSAPHVDLVKAAHRFRSYQKDSQPYVFPQGTTAWQSEPQPLSPTRRATASYACRDPGLVPPAQTLRRDGGFPSAQEALFVFVICMGQLVMLAAMAQALVPAQLIGQTFPGTSAGQLAWYSAAYGLTAGTFVLPSGRLGDVFGHKIIFVVGFLWLALWSFLAGVSPAVQAAGGQGTVFFCLCRAMQGVGSALVVPNGQAMMGRAYPPGPRKNVVMSVFGAAAPLGFVVGAAMSSLFAEQAQWPWAFWTLAAFCVALAALGVMVLPSAERPLKVEQAEERLWNRLDALGIVLGVCGLVLLNFAVNQAPIVSWNTPYTYFVLIISIMLLVAFVYTQRLAKYPLVPTAAMQARTNLVLGCTAAGWGCFGVWVYYSFALFETFRGWSPLTSSAAMAPGPMTGLAASILTGYLMSRGVRAHWIMFVSMCSFLAGSLLLATAPVSQSYWLNTFFGIAIMPFGMDMSNPAATILLSNSVSKEHQGIAASLVVTVVNYSISLALGIAGTIQAQVDGSGQVTLAGCRAAQYFGAGLGGLGVLVAAASLLGSYLRTSAPTKG